MRRREGAEADGGVCVEESKAVSERFANLILIKEER